MVSEITSTTIVKDFLSTVVGLQPTPLKAVKSDKEEDVIIFTYGHSPKELLFSLKFKDKRFKEFSSYDHNVSDVLPIAKEASIDVAWASTTKGFSIFFRVESRKIDVATGSTAETIELTDDLHELLKKTAEQLVEKWRKHGYVPLVDK